MPHILKKPSPCLRNFSSPTFRTNCSRWPSFLQQKLGYRVISWYLRQERYPEGGGMIHQTFTELWLLEDAPNTGSVDPRHCIHNWYITVIQHDMSLSRHGWVFQWQARLLESAKGVYGTPRTRKFRINSFIIFCLKNLTNIRAMKDSSISLSYPA